MLNGQFGFINNLIDDILIGVKLVLVDFNGDGIVDLFIYGDDNDLLFGFVLIFWRMGFLNSQVLIVLFNCIMLFLWDILFWDWDLDG